MSPVEEAAQNWLTPPKEEQTKLVLQGKCPHNKGWTFFSHGHNDKAYTCDLCGKMGFY